MDGKDLLEALDTVYILPGDKLTFVTAREFTPHVLQHYANELRKMFPDQETQLVTGVHSVLVERKPVFELLNKKDAADNAWQERQEAETVQHNLGADGTCGCISPISY